MICKPYYTYGTNTKHNNSFFHTFFEWIVYFYYLANMQQPSFQPIPQLSFSSVGRLETVMVLFSTYLQTPLQSDFENTQNVEKNFCIKDQVYVQSVYSSMSSANQVILIFLLYYCFQIPSAHSPNNEPAQHDIQEMDQMDETDKNPTNPEEGVSISVDASHNTNERRILCEYLISRIC